MRPERLGLPKTTMTRCHNHIPREILGHPDIQEVLRYGAFGARVGSSFEQGLSPLVFARARIRQRRGPRLGRPSSLHKVALLGLVSCLIAQHCIKLGGLGFFMAQDGLYRHEGGSLVQQRCGQDVALMQLVA
jgi:hypothetical protein